MWKDGDIFYGGGFYEKNYIILSMFLLFNKIELDEFAFSIISSK